MFVCRPGGKPPGHGQRAQGSQGSEGGQQQSFQSLPDLLETIETQTVVATSHNDLLQVRCHMRVVQLGLEGVLERGGGVDGQPFVGCQMKSPSSLDSRKCYFLLSRPAFCVPWLS